MPVGNFFLMVLGETSQGTRKIFAGGCALQMVKLYIRHCTKKRSKITFIRVCFFFCALAHGHSMPVCNFFLMSLGEGSQGTHKKFTGGCALQIKKLYFRHCTKKPSKITFIRGGGGGRRVCALAHGHSMPVGNFFLMVLGETSQGTRKIFAGGCALQMVKLYIRHCTKKRSKITFIRVCFFLCTGAWPQYAGLQFFPHESWGGVPRNAQKVYRGLCAPDNEVVFSSLYEETIEDHFYKGRGGGVCALAHGHSMPVGNFFLMVLGETSQGTRKIFAGGCALQMVKLYIRHCTKKRSKITFIRVCFFLCTGAWPQYAGLQFFPHESWGGVPRNAQKVYRGLCAPDNEVVFSSLYEETIEDHFYKGRGGGGGFVHWRMATVCRLAIFSSWFWGKRPKERAKYLPGAARCRW